MEGLAGAGEPSILCHGRFDHDAPAEGVRDTTWACAAASPSSQPLLVGVSVCRPLPDEAPAAAPTAPGRHPTGRGNRVVRLSPSVSGTTRLRIGRRQSGRWPRAARSRAMERARSGRRLTDLADLTDLTDLLASVAEQQPLAAANATRRTTGPARSSPHSTLTTPRPLRGSCLTSPNTLWFRTSCASGRGPRRQPLSASGHELTGVHKVVVHGLRDRPPHQAPPVGGGRDPPGYSKPGGRTVNCETASRPVEVANPWGR
jgi:hypothetical protein